MTGGVSRFTICSMEKDDADRPGRGHEIIFAVYDPDDLPYEKQHICKIISELPEVTPEEIDGYKKD